jgi:protein-tyrosine phosphatase
MENKLTVVKCWKCKTTNEKVKSYNTRILCRPCYLIEKDLHYKLERGKTFLLSDFTKVNEKVLLGNSDTAMDKELLRRNGITHILILGSFLHEFYPEDFQYKTIEIEDEENVDISRVFINCFKFIETADRVYVHCFAGKSRSPAIVIAYLMWKEGRGFTSTYEMIKINRSCLNVNRGFRFILTTFQTFLKTNCGGADLLTLDMISLSYMKNEISKNRLQSV